MNPAIIHPTSAVRTAAGLRPPKAFSMHQTTLLILWCLALTGCISTKVYQPPGANLSNIQRVAVLPFTPPPGMDKDQARGISEGVCDMVATALMQRGFEVVERARVQEILKERNLNLSESPAGERLVELGRILGVDALATGAVTEWREYRGLGRVGAVGITLKVYDAANGSLYMSGSGGDQITSLDDKSITRHAQDVVATMCRKIRR